MVGNFILIKCQHENSIYIYHTNHAGHVQRTRTAVWMWYFHSKMLYLLASWLVFTHFSAKNTKFNFQHCVISPNMLWGNHTEHHFAQSLPSDIFVLGPCSKLHVKWQARYFFEFGSDCQVTVPFITKVWLRIKWGSDAQGLLWVSAAAVGTTGL